MPGSATAIRQERLKKTHARPVPLGLFTINEEDEQQKNGNSRRPKGMHPPSLWLELDPALFPTLLVAQVPNCTHDACLSEYS